MFIGRLTNLPHVPRLRALLDAPSMVRDPVSVIEGYRRTFGPTFTVHMGGGRPALVTTDPAVARHVLQGAARTYEMSTIRVERMAEFQGHGLLNSHGEAWRRRRLLLGKGFTPSRLADLVPIQEGVLRDSFVRLDDAAQRGPVDMGRMVLWMNFRLFGRSVFGSRMTDGEIEQIASTIRTIQRFIVRQIVQPYLIPWYRLRGISSRHQRLRRDAERIARDYIAGRTDGESGDLLEIMLETPYPGPGERMSEDQVLVEALQLFVAGNETSPTALSWALYLLARHPEMQAEMREEISEVLGDGPATLDALHRLALTGRVLKETLRLYPSFWMIDRVAREDDRIGDARVPAGLTTLIYLYGLHRNTSVWSDPERFDPSRFEPEARRGRDRFAYLPFGGGARKCIGSTMAVAQMLLVLARLVGRYDFRPAEPHTVGVRPMMILHPDRPIRLHVTRVREGSPERGRSLPGRDRGAGRCAKR